MEKKKTSPVTAKAEVKTEVPEGFVRCVVLKDYDDKVKGEHLVLVERRYKSLKLRGFVK